MRCLLPLTLAVLAVAPALTRAAELLPPRLDGDLAGGLTLAALPGLPPLAWRVTARSAAAGRLHADLSAVVNGSEFRAAVEFDPVTQEGSWRLEEMRLGAAAWLPVLAPQLGTMLEGIVAQGVVTVSGEGELHDGRPAGRIKLAWADGALSHAGQGWSLEGIAFQGEFAVAADAPTLRSAEPATLTIRTVTTTRFGARNISIAARLDDLALLTLLSGSVEVAGGEVTVERAAIPLSPPALNLTLRISRVGLQDLVALVPAGLADARGRIDGVVAVSWSAAEGFQVGAGGLALRDDEPALVRLAPAPGFLTRHVPEHIALLPAWTGPLARWTSPLNPAYADVQAIELGRTELRLKKLDVRLTPGGDERGRSGSVELIAYPAQVGGTVKVLNFEIGVAGPLDALMKMEMNQKLAVEVH